MRILAIDPGTILGWATDSSDRLEWGTQDFSLRRGESPGMKFHRFNCWLAEMVRREGRPPAVGMIVYEQAHHRGGAATDVLVGMTTRIHELCATTFRWSGPPPSEGGKSVPLDYCAVHSASLKAFALGRAPKRKKCDPKMDRSKAAMERAAAIRLVREGTSNPMGVTGDGFPIAAALSEHEADALWLYWYAKETLIP